MTLTRVRWRERQRVTAADLMAEQDYRLRALGRHHLGPHSWGLVRGLWLVPTQPRARMNWRITEGVAIDGYGRELLVTRPIELTLPAEGPFNVFLYYCEAPVSRPPCAPCQDEPRPRVGQFVHHEAEQFLEPLTGDWPDPAAGRAAGPMPGHEAWPVFLGVVSSELASEPDYTSTRYHRQRAALLRGPWDRTLLRLGLLGPDDAYRMLLSTASGESRPARRLAVDRDGQIHVWRPLAVTGPHATGLVQISQKAILTVQGEMPTGLLRRVRLTGRLEDPLQPRLTVNWRDTLGLRLEERVSLGSARSVLLDERIRFAGGNLVAMRVVSSTRARRVSVVERPKANPEPRLIAESFEVELTPSGGRLELTTFDPQVVPPGPQPCDPPAESRGGAPPASSPGAVLQLLPAAEYTPGPAARELYAQSTPAPDGTPGTECRINGGALDDGDRTSRVGFGVRDGDGDYASTATWQPVLTMDGGGRVAMPQKDTLLEVRQTLQLPAITTDPADPLTQDLLALAYNAGLRRVNKLASSSVSAKLSQVDTSVANGDTLGYRIEVTGATDVKRMLEIVYGVEGNGDWTLRSIPVPTAGTLAAGYEPQLPPFWHRASKVMLRIELLVDEGGKDRAKHVEAGPITITP